MYAQKHERIIWKVKDVNDKVIDHNKISHLSICHQGKKLQALPNWIWVTSTGRMDDEDDPAYMIILKLNELDISDRGYYEIMVMGNNGKCYEKKSITIDWPERLDEIARSKNKSKKEKWSKKIINSEEMLELDKPFLEGDELV